MKIDKNRLIAFLWTCTILFYLLRSVLEPFKYFFLIFSGLLIISFFLFNFSDFKGSTIINFLKYTKEFQILGLFLVMGIALSEQVEILPLKALINFLGISVFYLIYLDYKDHIKLIRLFKGWIVLSLLMGLLGLLKWLNLVLELNIGWFSYFYNYGASLVPDYNFYSLFFIISLVIYSYALYKEITKAKLLTNQVVLFIFLSNVILSGSRRGLIVLALFLIATVFLMVYARKKERGIFVKNLFHFHVLIYSILVIFIALIPFRSKIIQNKPTKSKIAVVVYRYSTIVIPGISYSILFDKLWPETDVYISDTTDWDKYATYNNSVDGKIENRYKDLKKESRFHSEMKKNVDNLIYNGDFKYGLNFWTKSAPDSIKHEIISTKYGNALRVSRFEGNGYWPLEYSGRELFYHEGITYTFRFKFRVIKGSRVPFMIGWWFNEGSGFNNNLSYNIKALDEEWFEYTASHKFKSNQTNLQTFMNSLQSNTIVDFADIELTCNDSLNRPRFLDQLTNLEGANLLYNSNFKNGEKFWGSKSPDPIRHDLIETEYGKAIRVTRNDGEGYWPLAYQGRHIYYHRDLTYSFRFKFRVVEGAAAPFDIGWWIPEEEQPTHKLHKDIFPLENQWFECITSCKFTKDHYGDITTFMNSQEANSIIDFADIELICNDTLNRSMYADEMIDVIIALEDRRISEELDNDKGVLLSNRIERWKFANELWRTEYSILNKIFGGGFDYLDKFGQKFYPDEDRIDYPHNPIISSFLYSGIIGGIFYIYFLALSFWYFWKYRKNHMLFFILFLITFVFVFISSDTHFNVPIFAVLSLVPFITRYVVEEKVRKNPL